MALVYHSNQEAAESLVAELAARGRQVRALQADVRDLPAGPGNRRSASSSEWQRIDVLVNSAGIVQDGLLGAMTARQWRDVIDTNLGGTFNYCHAVTPADDDGTQRAAS